MSSGWWSRHGFDLDLEWDGFCWFLELGKELFLITRKVSLFWKKKETRCFAGGFLVKSQVWKGERSSNDLSSRSKSQYMKIHGMGNTWRCMGNTWRYMAWEIHEDRWHGKYMKIHGKYMKIDGMGNTWRYMAWEIHDCLCSLRDSICRSLCFLGFLYPSPHGLDFFLSE